MSWYFFGGFSAYCMRAVGPMPKPFGMLAHIRMVGRTLKGDVQGDLHATSPRLGNQAVEILQAAQCGIRRPYVHLRRPRSPGCRQIEVPAARPSGPRKADTRPYIRNWAPWRISTACLPRHANTAWRSPWTWLINVRRTIPTCASIPNGFGIGPTAARSMPRTRPRSTRTSIPFDFETEAWHELWEELKDVALFWVRRGVRIFRVDNPHTKPFPFWRWLIEEIQAEYPDVIFLAEAFTRPKVMYDLAKLGFTQSYTYFTWRNTKEQLTRYFSELTQTDVREYFRPNLWTNTPDILAEYLQYGGRAAFLARLVLAATLGANYGIYGPAFELMENRAREAGERRIPGFGEIPDPAVGHRKPRRASKTSFAGSIGSAARMRPCSATATCASIRSTTINCSATAGRARTGRTRSWSW